MANIRVYELAKDFNMTNKALLVRLKELKIDVKSHMSALDLKTVKIIKERLFGKSKQKTDVKVRSSVIRRRRKKEADFENLVVKEESLDDKPQEVQEEISYKKEIKKEVELDLEISKDLEAKAKEKQLIQAKQEKKSLDDKTKEIVKKVKKKKTTPAKIVKVIDPAALKSLNNTLSDKRKKFSDTKTSQIKADKKTYDKKDLKKPDFKIESLEIKDIPLSIPDDPPIGKYKKDRKKDFLGGDKPVGRRKRKKKSVIESDALYTDNRGRRKFGRKKNSKSKKENFQKTELTIPKAIKRRIKIDDAIELSELAKRMGIKVNEMIAKLMTMGFMATVNQTIDFDTAVLVASEFDFEVEKASFEEEDFLKEVSDSEDESKMVECPPVVTIMGHVNHGKTSLLDVIRESKVASGEAGGITQQIGAYNVITPNGGKITFLDTPGHAAFTAMRSRGAKITDIVILVVAADDGVQPQTIEAINHSKAAGVPIIVAINKMDKDGVDPERVTRELADYDLLSEKWGGNVIFVEVSAKTGQGIDEMLEMILLQSEVLELKANPDRNASGYVIDSKLDTGRGAIAAILVKQGSLKTGDAIVCGSYYGKIKAMFDESGKSIVKALPSTPAEIVGLNGVPDAGDEFISVNSEKNAKQIALHRQQKTRSKELAKKSRSNLEKVFENLGTAEIKELRLIVKADVQGSIEALNNSLEKLAKKEVQVNIIHSSTGAINDSDVSLAAVSDAIIIGFNIRPASHIRQLAKDENVDMRFYDVIFDVTDDIKAALEGMMPSTFKENIIGAAEVRNTFNIPKMGTIAGCYIIEGQFQRNKKIRLLRDGVVKCNTTIASLKRYKDDVKEVEEGFECGISLEKFNDIKIGDVIECYEVNEIKYKTDK